jgi:hypothetical protein
MISSVRQKKETSSLAVLYIVQVSCGKKIIMHSSSRKSLIDYFSDLKAVNKLTISSLLWHLISAREDLFSVAARDDLPEKR